MKMDDDEGPNNNDLVGGIRNVLGDTFDEGLMALQFDANFCFRLDVGQEKSSYSIIYRPKLVALDNRRGQVYWEGEIPLSRTNVEFIHGLEPFRTTYDYNEAAAVLLEDGSKFFSPKGPLQTLYFTLLNVIDSIEHFGSHKAKDIRTADNTVSVRHLDELSVIQDVYLRGPLLDVKGPLVRLPVTYRTETNTQEIAKSAVVNALGGRVF